MSQNAASPPYIIHLNETIQTIQYASEINTMGIDPNQQIFVGPVEEVDEDVLRQKEQPCIVQIVYPQELSLSPAPSLIKPWMKRGRPKKKKQEEVQVQPSLLKQEVGEPPKSARTRSGRLVKLPKHIEQDFKKIEITADEQEVQLSDFKRFEEKENPRVEFPEVHSKKRVISAQYKCPKCCKAYLGKNKMIEHLKKFPDHGPLPEGYQEFNFDVWNYLFDITQKSKSGQRGVKFCEELSNLLHNVQLLKSALFKTVTDNKNCVQIDKVLGNAIGLAPGKYKFDENELYKDVTVLKLITNSDFFKPNVNNSQKQNSDILKNKNDTPLEHGENKKLRQDAGPKPLNLTLPTVENVKENVISHKIEPKNHTKSGKSRETYSFNHPTDQSEIFIKGGQNEVTDDNFPKKMDIDNQISLPSDLLTENLLLHAMPNPRNGAEEFILSSVGVDNSSNLLDNSTSSDEVMNVDQFVNERFKKIIEPDIELSNTSLNLDLPSLELFQFHTS